MMTRKPINEYFFRCKVCGKEWSFMFEGFHYISDRCPVCGTMNSFKKCGRC